ncbi:hypothetical protein [Pseudarthrobacter niigatensis]|uniref:Membrane protein n=1 Tax=Pseudarthrobacter niigatensis TaxID=369935 RepID=A0AAJ1WEL9_9MICC|nr:hypothetical protein [Pseudarthrobacter niigatensis]MDQ0144750.1 putative membrane protein [Pseudarthrobacter niigatensis]MDQ0265397.1 putative membrane protein [Pseudarthrobacter niigatensis]
MTGPLPEVRWPADQPQHPLDYWLSPELAQVSAPEAPSRLRVLADAQGTVAAGWSGAIGVGAFLVLAGAYITVLAGSPVWVIVLSLAGAALSTLGMISWKQVRRTLPGSSRLVTRGPGSARGGILMVTVLDAIVAAIFIIGSPSAATNGSAGTLLGAYLLFTALLTVCILIPSVVLGRARQSFRQRIQTDAGLRAAVEQDLATWRDPYGNAGYGPL